MTKLFKPTAQLKIALTPKCNNDCPICLNKTTRNRNDGVNEQLSVDKIKQLIDEASDIGMIGVYWTGGEPLMEYENLLKLSDYSSERGLLPTVITNGGLIGAYGNYKKQNQEILNRAGLFNLNTKQIVKSLKDAGVIRVYFSVDSSHTTLQNVYSDVYNAVPTEAVSRAINEFLNEGYGKKHSLDAIGYQLRVTATSSGSLDEYTNQIVEDVMNKLGMNLKEKSTNSKVYENEKGQVFLRHLNVASIGDAEKFDDDILENKKGEDLFDIECPHFIPRENAYDGGKHHGDLFIDCDGIVYTCGNHAYPVGDIYEESLVSIIDGINNPRSDGRFGLTRKVYHSLLVLSRYMEIENMAIGKAFQMIYQENPELLDNIQTQCGACSCLGYDEDLQKAFINAFCKQYS
ncbi:radical SAM protein [Natranaerobius thermophilus]|uniref:Radical SAM domain protein n=1 Tax=Natranaerobius thermophilus (strain ATCC BAA-1301 / DSM 18059 / JW/NM-WN-LF) TaxID=457570 RepID=B2A1C3_NATTJ|nr:radical SAM/SPASM domain-containing protein [Natranaerobius thermophilus]ACB86061.1 Radical SAM domain protein [Natranaerobius thermophilus JW/NM-WN-LF]